MCNKICGGAHYKMKMIVVVKDEASYKEWMLSKSKETFKDKYFPAAAVESTTTVADTSAVTM
jgi:heme/copper-type cytochrome/quinol oxidase subunit 2